jgi:hypothetical protein
MVAGLGDRKDQATRGEKKKMIAAHAELKKSSDTGSWGTSCLSPAFVCLEYQSRLTTKLQQKTKIARESE